MECAEKPEWCGSEHAHVLRDGVKELESLLKANTLLRKRAESDLEHAHASVVREMNACNAETEKITKAWDAAIKEAGKERIVFIAKKDILYMDNDMKVRKQMRNEIVKALQKLKAEAGR